MKEKKKMSLAMQIFIALVLAIIAGLLMQSLPCRTAHAGFFVCPRSLRPAPLDGDGENEAANG